MRQTPAWIDGTPVTAKESVQIRNPYTRDVIAEVPLCREEHVDAACRAAQGVFLQQDFPAYRRAEVLERAAGLLREQREDFARTVTREGGKPISAARAEIARCVDTLTFSAVEARTLTGEMIPMEASRSGSGKWGFARREPVGVVGAITPFNFPVNLVAHKLAPAIAAGCPVVLKPAPQTPLSALGLVQLFIEAGLPPNWISVVTDAGREAGQPLVAHPIPGMITFTGSAAVGWQIAAQASRKKVALELGSTSPVIVEPDADLARAVAGIRTAGFANAGQSCISVQQVLFHERIRDDFVPRVEAAVKSVPAGDPFDEDTIVGPLIHPRENDRLREWVQEAVDKGASLLAGGDVRHGIFAPTLLEGVPPACRIWCREAFGPVVVLQGYRDFREAIRLANDSDCRLHAGVFTRDLARALEAADQLRFGGVLVNEIPTWRADQQPYGGAGDAGNTREGPRYAAREMTELKFVSFQP